MFCGGCLQFANVFNGSSSPDQYYDAASVPYSRNTDIVNDSDSRREYACSATIEIGNASAGSRVFQNLPIYLARQENRGIFCRWGPSSDRSS